MSRVEEFSLAEIEKLLNDKALLHQEVARLTARLEKAERVVEAARKLNSAEDFSEPLGPGQYPSDWDAYNAARRKLYDALAAYSKE